MSYIKWDNNLLIGIEEIDAQHKHLFELINNLHEKLVTGQGHDVLTDTINSLVLYVHEHFTTEENYMERQHYPEYESQKKEHNIFYQKVKSFQAKYKTNSPLLARDILIFLGEWYRKHIAERDKKIGEYMRTHSEAEDSPSK